MPQAKKRDQWPAALYEVITRLFCAAPAFEGNGPLKLEEDGVAGVGSTAGAKAEKFLFPHDGHIRIVARSATPQLLQNLAAMFTPCAGIDKSVW